MTKTLATPHDTFDRLREQGLEAQRAGRARQALDLFRQALAKAREDGDPKRIDLALCNQSSAEISLGSYLDVRGALRAVLMRRSSVEGAFLAADNLSRSYELTKEFKKGLFYARVARDHALASNNLLWRASTHNQSGNCLLGDSFFREAAEEYQQAIALVDQDHLAYYKAGIRLNLGYCQCVLGNHREAFRLTFGSLRHFRRCQSTGDQAWAHLDLCHAYVQIDRAERARRHGLRALEMAEAVDDQDLLKNTLFMLGEAERMAGLYEEAHTRFTRLQECFYPDQPNLADLMLAVELRQIVNLRA